MRFPGNLPHNGTIGFLAPSFGCATEPYKSAFKNALNNFKKMGYKLHLGPNCFEGIGIGISNTPQKCGAEVMEMFESDADCLISCGGGELMCEILSYVDFDKLSGMTPKWFIGYSDNTNLTFLLATLADTASIYGPCAKSFGMEPWHSSIHDAFSILCGSKCTIESYGMWESEGLASEENPLLPYHLTQPLVLRKYIGKKEVVSGMDEVICFGGRLLGGCMDCLVTILGTRFDKVCEFNEKYKRDGIIWFLEACDLNVFGIRRAMWQMEQAGWFQYIKGFLIGRPANGETIMNLDAYDAILETAGKYDVPVIMDVDIGHLPPMMPIVVGSIADIKVTGNHLSIEMKYE